MKRSAVVLFLCALVVASYAIKLSQKAPTFSLCPTCVSFTGQAINQLLNIILNAGVIGTCGELCSKLNTKTEQSVCDLLCDGVGVDAFIHLIEKADLDPIYFCQLLHICPIQDCVGDCVDINIFESQPQQGPQGTTFNFDLGFTVNNKTGTGEIDLVISPPDGEAFGDGELNEGFEPGQYSIQFQLQAQPSEDEAFNPGSYQVDVAICNGECGSNHPHSYVFATAATNFTITQ